MKRQKANKYGDSKTPIESYKTLEEVRPDDNRFAQNVAYYKKKINEGRYQTGESNHEGTIYDPLDTNSHQNPSKRPETAEYERLCRSELGNFLIDYDVILTQNF